MKFTKTILSCSISILVLLAACVDPYKIDILANDTYLVVDGTLTNIPERQLIRIFETKDQTRYRSSEFSATISPVENSTKPLIAAVVGVLENGNQFYPFSEIEPGIYGSPFGFEAKAGNSYQLIIETGSKKYESNPEKMLAVPVIDRVYEVYNSKGVNGRLVNNVQTPSNDFYVDFVDPADETNFYRWRWKDYELQNYCLTCQKSRLVRPGNPEGECVDDPFLPSFNKFDYVCDAFCWDFLESDGIDIFSDRNANGNPQKGKLVAQIPVFQSNSCLVVIEQMSLTANAFRYYKLASEQSINSGSLADTPPAPNRSNVYNVADKSELVLGFFTVSDVAEARLMLVRDDPSGAMPNTLFRFQNNREPNIETQEFGRLLIPKARCKATVSRTPNAPRNWQFGL